MAVTQCRYFTGYKPCGRSSVCDDSCQQQDIPVTRLLLIHLGALGAVVRSTALLAPLRRKFPKAHLTWVTDKPADQLLRSHPLIDRVLTTTESDLLALSVLEFDAAFVVDKSLKAVGVLKKTRADLVFGFTADSTTGAILPATSAAEELWNLGLNDHQKFFINQKSEIQLTTEALELGPWSKDAPMLPLSSDENRLRMERHRAWSENGRFQILGLNTGCSDVLPMKKWTVEGHRAFISQMLRHDFVKIVLLGGPEDTARNLAIAEGLPVILSPTTNGLRDGLTSVAACDAVVTGDSLGMHLAISQKIWTVAWFGATCAHEIELYGRGEAVLAKVDCGPCWKRACSKPVMCYDQVDFDEVETAVLKGLSECRQPQPTL